MNAAVHPDIQRETQIDGDDYAAAASGGGGRDTVDNPAAPICFDDNYLLSHSPALHNGAGGSMETELFDAACSGAYDQLLMSFQGEVYVFDGVSPQKVQAVVLLLRGCQVPDSIRTISVATEIQRASGDLPGKVYQPQRADNAHRKRTQYNLWHKAAMRMQHKKGRFISSQSVSDESGSSSAYRNERSGREELETFRCSHCGINSKSTSQMRGGPTGPKSLCNACGLTWSKKVIYTMSPNERFVDPKAKARYMLSLAKRNFTYERGMKIDEINTYCPSFWRQIVRRGWQRLVETVGDCNETLVHEFYANICKARKSEDWTVRMRGKDFHYDARTINTFYGLEHVEKTVDFWEKLGKDEDAREWASTYIARPPEPGRPSIPEWATRKETINKKYLKFEAKSWWGFVHTRVMPTKSDDTLLIEHAILLAAIMADFPINVGEILVREIKKVGPQNSNNCILGSLLTGLMREQGIPERLIDNVRLPPDLHDIFKSDDPLNPKILARRASMVPPGQSNEPCATTLPDVAGLSTIR